MHTLWPELEEIVRSRNFVALRDRLAVLEPADLADLMSTLPAEDMVLLFRVLPRKDSAATFEYLPFEKQEALLRAMGQSEVAAILDEMSPDDRTTLFEELPGVVTKRMLNLLSPEERQVAVNLLGYPERSVGRWMTPHYVAVRQNWTMQQVLDNVRKHGRDSETINMIYVIDDRGVMIDDIPISDVLLAPVTATVADLMDRSFFALKATDDQSAAVAVFRQSDAYALPVTDTSGVLIGIVTLDDVLDLAEEEATEDIQKLGGMEALDEPYLDTPWAQMVRKRAGWLVVLFLSEMLTATAMTFFEDEIARVVILALFVPLIISSGGNSGSQAASLVIRALALGEVRVPDWWRVARREILSGLMLGTILGVIGFVRITLTTAIFPTIYGEHWILIALTIGLALVGVVLWGTIAGSMLPILLHRLGFDPASSSAPFVATLVDVTGLVIYFGIAALVLKGTLL
jgi:magnesium transporter